MKISRKLVILLIAGALAYEVFSPGIESAVAWSLVVKKGPGRIRADFPSGWQRLDQGTQVMVRNPCWTVFCSSPRSVLIVDIPERHIWRDDAWGERAKKEFADGQFGSTLARVFPSGLGQIECLEARKGPNMAEVRCYGGTSGLTASFSGTATDLEKFYRAVASVRLFSQ